jgi:transcriptional regulator with XRE-family HTH domain
LNEIIGFSADEVMEVLLRNPPPAVRSLSCLGLGDTIRLCRIALGMSQLDLAARIKRSLSFVHDLEQARIDVDIDILEDCAAVFGLSAGEMVELALSESVLLVAEAGRHQKRKRLRLEYTA